MCIIIFSPNGMPIPDSDIRTAWNNGNDDGAGYVFVTSDNELIIRKPFFRLNALLAAYHADHIDHPDSVFLMHLRLATNGKPSEQTTHPFLLDNGQTVLAHNGILTDFAHNHNKSDTVLFCQTVLSDRTPAQLLSHTFAHILADMIGGGNKFVILANNGEYSIINEDAGEWNSEIWYSNTTYRKGHLWIDYPENDDYLDECKDCDAVTCEGCDIAEQHDNADPCQTCKSFECNDCPFVFEDMEYINV